MKYNRPQATASWGMMAKDWEKGITNGTDLISKTELDQMRQRNGIAAAPRVATTTID